MKSKEIKFRASRAAVLMSGGNEITEKQLSELHELEARANAALVGGAKPLTANMQSRAIELMEKRDAPFGLGQSAKTYVDEIWREKMYNYKQPVVTNVLLKGLLCEQDCFRIVSEVWPEKEFRAKNKDRFENDFFTGTPDDILKTISTIEDVKACWDLRTFHQKDKPDDLYFGQAQIYMNLTGMKKFRLHYCLVNTPDELVFRELKKYFYMFGQDEANEDYQEIANQFEVNHNFDHIPVKQRVKTYLIDYDQSYMDKLVVRAKAARAYYKTIVLNDTMGIQPKV